jgi:uncharacterized protein YqgC (DUF456 family)
MTDILLWTLSAALIVVGVAGTVLPALPGTALVLAGIVLGAWIDDFVRVGPGMLSVARRARASREAIIGAAVGTVLGLFMGLVGVLFMPLLGAAAGEYLALRDGQRALKVGAATWLGLMVGLIAKVVIAFVMIGLFVAALLI